MDELSKTRALGAEILPYKNNSKSLNFIPSGVTGEYLIVYLCFSIDHLFFHLALFFCDSRWSKIAQYLPGRTDNEIKNYWRTRVQKQARLLKIESNSKRFLETIQCFWMPRLLEKMEQTTSSSPSSSSFAASTMETQYSLTTTPVPKQAHLALSSPQERKLVDSSNHDTENSSSNICSSDSMRISELPEISEPPTSPPAHAVGNTAAYNNPFPNDCYYVGNSSYDMEGFNQATMSAGGTQEISLSDCQMAGRDWTNDDLASTLWNMDELW
ncbi:hypothetical protein F0562_032726 [Nyssa sinensis]|uniref:Uncharacterized protein n=1 Tax=Nyssa sinensis TaxID=561372 RepID=A0A5J5ANV1_9ASTE|nr:hypothetical protein F0562_032726 [Nyssa sinensis]